MFSQMASYSIGIEVGGVRNTSCVIISGGTMKCWDKNRNGEFGDGTTTQRNKPVSVSSISNVTDITANGHLVADYGLTCALLSDNGAKCWGVNGEGQAGSGSISPRFQDLSTPTLLYGL